jgi:hypothetical protein
VGDRRVVQCFGTKRKPGKADKPCRKQWLWTARGANGNFGSKGCQNCPHCGTMPDFQHPFNQYLSGDLTHEQAEAAMPAYIEMLNSK